MQAACQKRVQQKGVEASLSCGLGRPCRWAPRWALSRAQAHSSHVAAGHVPVPCWAPRPSPWLGQLQFPASGCLHSWLSAWTPSANSLAFLFQRRGLECLNSPTVMLLSRGDNADSLKFWQLHSLLLLKWFWSCICLELLLTVHLDHNNPARHFAMSNKQEVQKHY